MPFLKFSRDRRGYESTYLLHSSRRQGTERARLLYWFRSPPHVKVGRAAFDEEAIRLLEEQHPDVAFDWTEILEAKAPAAPPPREGFEAPRENRPARREGRAGREPRSGDKTRVSPRPSPIERRATPRPDSRESRRQVPEPSEPLSPQVTEPPAAEAAGADDQAVPVPPAAVAGPPREAKPVPDIQAVPEPPRRRLTRVFDVEHEPPVTPISQGAAVQPAHHATDPSVAERVLGPERLMVLRARYAEILARISARGGDPARADALREQAERANPDAWVTESEVSEGLAHVDEVLEELHKIVGRRRRRRRRRGRGGVVEAGSTEGEGSQQAAAFTRSDGDEDEEQDEENEPAD